MKSIYLTIAFVLSTFMLNAQSDQLVKVLVNKAQLEFLTTNSVALADAITVVDEAFKKADNYTIGKTKGDIIKIVHEAPSILSNINAMAQATLLNPDAIGERNGISYDTFVANYNTDGTFEEIELLPEEVKALSILVTKMKSRKKRLKETGYAIHESQSSKGAASNVASLGKFSEDLAKAIEIIKIGQHR